MKKTLSEQLNYFLASRLALLREKSGMTREQLASLTNFSARDIYRLELAHATFGPRDIAILATHLGVRPNEFFTGFQTSFDDAAMLNPLVQRRPSDDMHQLVLHFLSISCTEIRQSLGAAARQAGRHY